MKIPIACLIAAVLSACSCKAAPPAPEAHVDPGATQSPQRLDPPAAVGSLGGNLAQDGEAVLATWLEPIAAAGEAAGPSSHRVRFARLAGGVWSAPSTIAEGPSVFANWADVPSVVRGGDGALVAHWAQRVEGGPYSYNVALARSADDGKSWTPLGLAHDDGTATEHGFVSLIPAATGVRAFWLDGREMAGGGHGSHGSGAMTLRTALVGESISSSQIVDPRVCDCCGTAAVSVGGRAAVAYRDRSSDEVRDIWIARESEKGWSEPRAVHEDKWTIPGCPVNGPAVAADDARLVVAWYTYAGERNSVRVAFSDDSGASFAAPIEVDGPRGRTAPIGRVGVVLAGPGKAIVTWMSSNREDAMVLARRVTSDGLVGEPLRVFETKAARAAGFPRIARSGDSLGVMYTETGDRTQVRFWRIPLGVIPEAHAKPSGPEVGADSLLALGSPLPTYDVEELDGTRTSVNGLAGTVTLVNLWATWCEPCRHEMPVLSALQETHAAAGLRVVGISVDRDRTNEELAQFAERRKLSFAVWHDAADLSSNAFGAGALPASFLFDRSGKLVWRRAGAVTEGDESLRTALAAALADD